MPVNRLFHRISQLVLYHGIIRPASFLLTRFAMRTRVHGRAPSQGPAVLVCNHVHPFDELAVVRAAGPRMVFFGSQSSNFKIPVAGAILRYFGTLELEPTTTSIRRFYESAHVLLGRGSLVGLFPEGQRGDDPTVMGPLRRGAFELAVKTQVPVVVCRLVPTGRMLGIWWRRPQLDMWVSEPIWPAAPDTPHATNELKNQAAAVFDELLARGTSAG